MDQLYPSILVEDSKLFVVSNVVSPEEPECRGDYEDMKSGYQISWWTYGATDMLMIGLPDQYSADLESPRRRAVIKALVAVLYR